MSRVADWFKKRNEAPAPERRLRILVVSMFLGDRLLLEQLGKQHDWELRFTNSPREGFVLASQSHFELILCDRYQLGYPWREVMGRLAAISPRTCILLVSPVNIDYLWRDVVQQGGYDVLTPRCVRRLFLGDRRGCAIHFSGGEFLCTLREGPMSLSYDRKLSHGHFFLAVRRQGQDSSVQPARSAGPHSGEPTGSGIFGP